MSRALVLDVGSGYSPYPDADILVDKFMDGDASSRFTSKVVVRPGQTLICAEAEALPFSDKSFDVVICRQVLEHVEDPIKACSELIRVAKAGFITAPCDDSMREDVSKGARLYHKWLIHQLPHYTYGPALHFYPRELVGEVPQNGAHDRHVIMFWVHKFDYYVHEELD